MYSQIACKEWEKWGYIQRLGKDSTLESCVRGCTKHAMDKDTFIYLKSIHHISVDAAGPCRKTLAHWVCKICCDNHQTKPGQPAVLGHASPSMIQQHISSHGNAILLFWRYISFTFIYASLHSYNIIYIEKHHGQYIIVL